MSHINTTKEKINVSEVLGYFIEFLKVHFVAHKLIYMQNFFRWEFTYASERTKRSTGKTLYLIKTWKSHKNLWMSNHKNHIVTSNPQITEIISYRGHAVVSVTIPKRSVWISCKHDIKTQQSRRIVKVGANSPVYRTSPGALLYP